MRGGSCESVWLANDAAPGGVGLGEDRVWEKLVVGALQGRVFDRKAEEAEDGLMLRLETSIAPTGLFRILRENKHPKVPKVDAA